MRNFPLLTYLFIILSNLNIPKANLTLQIHHTSSVDVQKHQSILLDIKIKIYVEENPIEIERDLVMALLELNGKLQRVSSKFDGVLQLQNFINHPINI